jgi:hypothetical protein
MKKLYLPLLCLFLTIHLSAQSKKKRAPAYNKQNKETDQFLQKQWWLGIKGGANIAQVNVQSSYAIFSPIGDAQSSEKKYLKHKGVGSQISMEVNFYFKSFSISFQPTYQHSQFSYTKNYAWGSAGETDRLEMKYDNLQKVDHILLPLILKYEITGDKIRPYVQAGFFQAILISGRKSITITGTDYASGGTNEFEREPIAVDATNLFAKYYWGIIGGAGLYYNLGNVRLNLDLQYKYGLSNITSTKNRYDNDMLVGAGDVMDDLNLNNISASIGCLFPLRFLGSGFKSLDRK